MTATPSTGAPYPPRYTVYSEGVPALFQSGLDAATYLAVRVVGMGSPGVVEGRPAICIKLRDVRNQAEFDTLPLFDLGTINRARDCMESGRLLQAHGRFVDLGYKPRRGSVAPVRFDVEELAEPSRPSIITGATEQELLRADETIDRLRDTPGAIARYMIERAHEVMGVVVTNQSERFKLAELAVMLQALSWGQVNESVNGRASLLLCSRPGASKKLMAHLALMLAPCGQMVQPTTVTPAGLGARVEQVGGGWKVFPGALPSCSGGALVLEDLHRLSPSHLNAIQGCLMAVAEDGKLLNNKAGRANYDATVALHINTNLQSVIQARLRDPGTEGKLKDMNTPADVMSRLDMIIDLTLGDNAARQARDIAIQIVRRLSPAEREEQLQKRRELQVLVARLIDRFEVVDLQPVQGLIGKLMDDISLMIADFSARMTDEQQQVFDGEGLLRRMANSVRKLVSASARLDGRAVASETDVARCWDLISFKLEVVRWLCNDQAARVRTFSGRTEMVERAERAAEARWNEILGYFEGQEVTVAQVAEELGYSVRCMGRDLEAHGVYPRAGRCRVPTLAEEAERVAAQRAGQGPPPEPEQPGSEDDFLEPEGSGHKQQAGSEDRPPGVDHKLPLLPMQYQPVVAALAAEQEPRERDRLVDRLLEVALSYNPHEFETPARLEAMGRKLRQRVHPEDEGLVRAVVDELKGRDPERSILALQLLSESRLPLQPIKMEAALSRKDLHPAVHNALSAVLEIDEYRGASPEERAEIWRTEGLFSTEWLQEDRTAAGGRGPGP